ncbi:hypothetical protein HPP92_028805 [Vanilla planifolia]|uniref:Uncharacterized protein n=1 Tax=Vanilla planifolia TaxID=51239 RepID=A0A835P613_VANPL|nr:hypothetical protein HPP92_028805 [Vanilla planifolia]KAG0446505.1 hypothetical protein HPP92_028794 [Vanilla planifolia]
MDPMAAMMKRRRCVGPDDGSVAMITFSSGRDLARDNPREWRETVDQKEEGTGNCLNDKVTGEGVGGSGGTSSKQSSLHPKSTLVQEHKATGNMSWRLKTVKRKGQAAS